MQRDLGGRSGDTHFVGRTIRWEAIVHAFTWLLASDLRPRPRRPRATIIATGGSWFRLWPTYRECTRRSTVIGRRSGGRPKTYVRVFKNAERVYGDDTLQMRMAAVETRRSSDARPAESQVDAGLIRAPWTAMDAAAIIRRGNVRDPASLVPPASWGRRVPNREVRR